MNGRGGRPERGRGAQRKGRRRPHRPGPAARPAARRAPGELATVGVRYKRSSPHPWIWRTMLAKDVPTGLAAGDVVRVCDVAGEFVGMAFWHPHATIALRLLTTDPAETIDAGFFTRRLGRALALRRDVLRVEEETTGYRLAHAEADGLSGLVVDVLGDVVLGEIFSLGMARQADAIRAALGELLPGKRVVLRGDDRAGSIEGFSVPARPDDPAESEVVEHGIRFHVDLRHGHKTGFFCDQRENREFLARLCRGRSVLDAHTYTGGFALHALLKGEAKEVTGVDLDEKAVAVATRNAKLNQARGVRFVQADAFAYLRELQRSERSPDVLVLDPPKLVRDRKELHEGLRVYADLNRLGLEVLGHDGLLLTCSCSGSVSEDDLLDVLRGAAARARREITILRVSGAAADHPVGLHVPESRYLKAVFARVSRLS